MTAKIVDLVFSSLRHLKLPLSMPQIFSTNLDPSGNLLLWYYGAEYPLWQVDEELAWFKDQLNLVPDLWIEYESLANEVIKHRWLASRIAPLGLAFLLFHQAPGFTRGY